ncbi:MAG TPA: FliH/SctL family protein [Acidisarcina sp.]
MSRERPEPAASGNLQGRQGGLIDTLRYEDIHAAAAVRAKDGPTELDLEHERQQICVLTVAERDEMLAAARGEGARAREREIGQEHKDRFEAEAKKIAAALEAFRRERAGYFSRVEGELVRLALAIAARILHREAQIDPLLLAALVRVAVNQLHDGSRVTVRVRPGDGLKWRNAFLHPQNGAVVEIVEDAHVAMHDCVLETDLGSANFNIEGQLKEVEQGFFDLLALRPEK